MSVLVADLKVYEAVYRKTWSYGFNKTCGLDYCHALSFSSEDIAKKLIKDWLWLNEYSWIRRYEEDEVPNLAPLLNLKSGDVIDTYQMLKFLQCIRYNIELETIKTGKTGHERFMAIPEDKLMSYSTLEAAIEEVKSAIINQIPEYKDAKWDLN